MEALIPEIVIGEKYLWTSFPIEFLCPECGINMGNGRGDYQNLTCIVLDTTSNYKRCGACYSCKRQWLASELEGWYVIRLLDNSEVGVVPYTQLTPLEEEK